MDRPFHQLQSPKVEVFLTRDRGWGVKAAEPVVKGSFIVEYAGKCFACDDAKPPWVANHLDCCMCQQFSVFKSARAIGARHTFILHVPADAQSLM